MPSLNPEFLLDERFKVPQRLRMDHDVIRAEFERASGRRGAVGDAAKRLAAVCLPHFEKEEKTVYPAFALLHDAAVSGMRADMAAVLPLVFHCTAWHDNLLEGQPAMMSAVDELRLALESEAESEFADLAAKLRAHEKVEEEVMYPAVIWMGRYMRERLDEAL